MKKYLILLSIISIFLIGSLIIGFSYSFWLVTKTQNSENLVEVGCFEMTMEEDIESVINLNNSYPVSDVVGMQSKPYVFSIKNNCSIDAYYKINYEIDQSSTLNPKFVKISLNDNKPIFLNHGDYEKTSDSYAYNLDSGILKENEIREFNFRMWLDEETTLNDAGGKNLVGKIVTNSVSLDAALKSLGDVARSLVYDGGVCRNVDSTYQYMGGCYLKGNVDDNYVWFSGDVWQIMGINSDDSIRLIAATSATSLIYNHGNGSDFNGSYVDDWLNNFYYDRLKNNYYIVDSDFCFRSNVLDASSAVDNCDDGVLLKRKVGLLTLDELNLAGTVDSYLDNLTIFWLMTSYDDNNIYQYDYGQGLAEDYNVTSSRSVRPVINVRGDIIVSKGEGLYSNMYGTIRYPYIVGDDFVESNNVSLANVGYVGEYVNFGDNLYRIIDKDREGNIKLMLEDYYRENNEIMKVNFGDDSLFTYEDRTINGGTNSGIGYLLYSKVLDDLVGVDDNNRSKLVNDYKWIQNDLRYGNSFRDNFEITENSNVVVGPIGLSKMGEIYNILSLNNFTLNGGISATNDHLSNYWLLDGWNSNEETWTMRYSNSSTIMVPGTEYYGFKPVIVVKGDSLVSGGNGFVWNPYQI